MSTPRRPDAGAEPRILDKQLIGRVIIDQTPENKWVLPLTLNHDGPFPGIIDHFSGLKSQLFHCHHL